MSPRACCIAALLVAMAMEPAVSAGAPSEPPPPALDPAARARLAAGEVLVETLDGEREGGAARVLALFHADAEQVWKVLGDCAANLRFVAGLEECELLEESPTRALTRQVVDRGWHSPRLEYRFATWREPYRWIVIRGLGGDLALLEGHWRFDPREDLGGLLVSHQIRLKPRVPAPRWLVRRTLRGDLGDMVACLRAEAEASGSQAQRAADRARCP